MIGPPGREPAANMDEFSAHKVETAIKLDARRTAVLVVDMLNDFCKPGGAMVLPGYERLIAPQRAIISAARQTDAPVVFIADSHRPNVRRDREFLKRTPHCVEGSWGARVIDDEILARWYRWQAGTGNPPKRLWAAPSAKPTIVRACLSTLIPSCG